MFEHILIPLDFTDKNDAALETAERIAAPDASHVTLLHVIEELAGPDDAEARAFYRKLERRAEENLERQVAAMRRAGLVCEGAIERGKRAQTVVRHALENDVDLIILSSRPLDPEKPSQPWPTISQQVALISPVAVLLVR